jgi:hypothetical protein
MIVALTTPHHTPNTMSCNDTSRIDMGCYAVCYLLLPEGNINMHNVLLKEGRLCTEYRHVSEWNIKIK